MSAPSSSCWERFSACQRVNAGETSIELPAANGGVSYIVLHYSDLQWQDQLAQLVVLHDVTERRRREIEQREHGERMNRVLFQMIQTISLTLEKRDPYTAGHQERVAQLAAGIGLALGLPQAQVQGLWLGGLIHDIGKIAVPSELLNRPGRLGPIEMALIREHPQSGYDIVKAVDSPWPLAAMVLDHHERLDGSGYPAGLKGTAIPLEARIIAVADVVEAISAHRPYRPALGIDKALEEIRRGRGRLYDAAAVDACLKLFRQGDFVYRGGVIMPVSDDFLPAYFGMPFGTLSEESTVSQANTEASFDEPT